MYSSIYKPSCSHTSGDPSLLSEQNQHILCLQKKPSERPTRTEPQCISRFLLNRSEEGREAKTVLLDCCIGLHES